MRKLKNEGLYTKQTKTQILDSFKDARTSSFKCIESNPKTQKIEEKDGFIFKQETADCVKVFAEVGSFSNGIGRDDVPNGSVVVGQKIFSKKTTAAKFIRRMAAVALVAQMDETSAPQKQHRIE